MSFTAGAGTRFVVTSTSSQSSGTVLTGPITATAGTATTDTPAFNITQTWNAGAVTFTGLRFNVTDTASAAGSLLMDLQVGGTSKFAFNKNATITFTGSGASSIFGVTAFGDVFTINRTLSSTAGGLQLSGGSSSIFGRTNSSSIYMAALAQIGFGSTSDNTGTNDAFITRDAAGTLAQRNGVNAQAFNIYNTFTDASNYERGFLGWSSNVLTLRPQSAGTGAVRSVSVLSDDTLTLSSGGNGRVNINSPGNTGVLVSCGTASFGINITNTALTTRTIFSGTLASGPGVIALATYSGGTNDSVVFRSQGSYTRSFSVGAAGQAGGQPGCDFYLFSGTANGGNTRGGDVYLYAPSGSGSGRNGQIILQNDGTNTYAGLICFGGTTASFPALKRNTTFLETKLADDSAYAPHAMQYLDVTDGITAPASASGRARIYVDTADGDLKVIFDDGTVKTIVTDTP